MRNLKKILALVLALMMALSVMVFASAEFEDYTDHETVNPQYAEAVNVLVDMGIIVGRGNMEIQPKGNVERSEVATLVYRVMTGDLNGSQVSIYEDYGRFTDVKETNWFAGYVNYAANSDWVVGKGDNLFDPAGYVTGYEMVTILLRLIGYDANDEISGSEWKITAARLAKDAGILGEFNEAGLGQALTREQVAYLLFNAMQARKVNYTLAFGYQPSRLGYTIAWDEFQMAEKTGEMDECGRPCTIWYQETATNADPTASTTNIAYNKGTDPIYATIEATPLATYYTAVTECDVAEDVNGGNSFTATTYTNGLENVDPNERIIATSTTSIIGAQGRTTEIYDADGNGLADRIVYVDTYLAKVTKVTPATYDTNGHEVTPASSEITIEVKGSSNVVATIAGDSYALNSYILVTTYGGGDFKSNHTTGGYTWSIDIVGTPTVAQATVKGTLGGDTNKNGIEATTGTQYLLNNTSTQTIANSMINQSYNLYLDAHNNIMLMVPVSAVSTNVGVVTATDFRAVGTNKYVAQADLFLADGTNATVSLVKNATTYYAQTDSADPSIPGVGTLVMLTSTTLDGATYYYVSEKETGTSDGDSQVATGVTDTLSNTLLVNDTTKFILADYKWNYATSKYDVAYTAFTGFKNLPMLKGGISYQSVNDGANVLIYATTATTPYEVTQKEAVTPDDSYLVLSKVNVTYERYSVYNVVKNGVMTTVNISNDINGQVDAFITDNQLVTFGGLTVDGYYTTVTATTQIGGMAKSAFTAAHELTYSNGVLKVVHGGYTKYLTVADNCTVQIVNREVNQVYSATLDHIAQYEPTHSVSFDLDANGYVCNLYIID